MTKPDPLVLSVACFGVAISLACLSFGGTFSGFSSAVGSVLALVNLVVLRNIVLRVVSGDIHKKMPLVALIFLKMGSLMFLVFWFISKRWVEPLTFTLGLSSLAVGLITGALFAAYSRPARSARPVGPVGHGSES
jgi:uncharacterized membrane protein